MYFGLYRWKSVWHIAIIDAVVDLEGDGTASLRWKNVDQPDTDLIARALEKRDRLRPGTEPLRIFLLGELHATDFKKPSKGGMQTSKRYFDIAKVGANDAADLAMKLKGKTWSDY